MGCIVGRNNKVDARSEDIESLNAPGTLQGKKAEESTNPGHTNDFECIGSSSSTITSEKTAHQPEVQSEILRQDIEDSNSNSDHERVKINEPTYHTVTETTRSIPPVEDPILNPKPDSVGASSIKVGLADDEVNSNDSVQRNSDANEDLVEPSRDEDSESKCRSPDGESVLKTDSPDGDSLLKTDPQDLDSEKSGSRAGESLPKQGSSDSDSVLNSASPNGDLVLKPGIPDGKPSGEPDFSTDSESFPDRNSVNESNPDRIEQSEAQVTSLVGLQEKTMSAKMSRDPSVDTDDSDANFKTASDHSESSDEELPDEKSGDGSTSNSDGDILSDDEQDFPQGELRCPVRYCSSQSASYQSLQVGANVQTVKVKAHRIRLLWYAIAKDVKKGTKKFSQCHLHPRLDGDNSNIVLYGNKKYCVVDIKAIKADLLELINDMDENYIDTSPEIGRVFSSKRGTIFLAEKGITGTVTVKSKDDEDEVILCTLSEDFGCVDDWSDQFQSLVGKDTFRYSSGQQTIMKGKDWRILVQGLVDSYLIDIRQVPDEEDESCGVIKVQGVRLHVEVAMKELKNQLNGSNADETLSFKKGIGRLLKEHGHAELTSITNRYTVRYSLEKVSQEWLLLLVGSQSNVASAQADIQDMARRVTSDQIEENRLGVLGLLKDPVWKMSIKGLEHDKKCAIDYQHKKTLLSSESFLDSDDLDSDDDHDDDDQSHIIEMRRLAHDRVIFHISAWDEKNMRQAKESLQQILNRNIQEVTMDINKDMLKRKNIQEEIKNLANETVGIQIDTKHHQVYITGMLTEVNQARYNIDNIIRKESSQDSLDLEVTEKNEGRLLRQAEEKVKLPDYWTEYRENLAENIGVYHEKGPLLIPVDQDMQAAVEALMQKTWDSTKVGLGRDAKNLHHKNINIVKVDRIENPHMWNSYDQSRKKMLYNAIYGHVPPVKGVKGQEEVMTATLDIAELKDLLIPEINEVFLFHGTNEVSVKPILRQGMDFRLGKDGGMFGKGIYFAECSTKADQYADKKHQRTGGHHQMFVTRVILGSVYVCENGVKYQRPPCTELTCEKADCAVHEHFHDSVMGVGRDDRPRPKDVPKTLLFREFIIYEKDRCYPEFLVTYKRKL